jgi:hypothetical protein
VTGAQVLAFPRRHSEETEPLLSKKQLAAYYGYSARWIELRVREGMPSEWIGGQRRFRLSLTDQWLRERR